MQTYEGNDYNYKIVNLKTNLNMKNKSLFNLYSLAFASFVLAACLCSCSHEKQGEVVIDSKGNYYELDGNDALGVERYVLKKIDTNKYKPIGF